MYISTEEQVFMTNCFALVTKKLFRKREAVLMLHCIAGRINWRLGGGVVFIFFSSFSFSCGVCCYILCNGERVR